MKVETSILPVGKLEMYDVVNREGADLGQVQTFMLDMEHGRISFVVVAFGGTLGINEKWFALPWNILLWSPEDKTFVVNMPRELLENAPGIDKKRWPYEIDMSWLEQCYAYFGCKPYWEETPEEQMEKSAGQEESPVAQTTVSEDQPKNLADQEKVPAGQVELEASEDETRKLAYGMWEQEGKPDGKDLEHYYNAKKILAKTENK